MLSIRADHKQSISTEIDSAFRADVVEGLASRPRAIPSRWLYDQRGSELFERITLLPEYYPTRTECSILNTHAGTIANLVGEVHAVVEFGSGSSEKTSTILSAIEPLSYVPIDVSKVFLQKAAANLALSFPGLTIHPIEADFTCPVRLPTDVLAGRRLGFFAGSTIGNLPVPAAVDLLRAFASILGDDGMLLIGVDRPKDVGLLEAAYDDAIGVTAEFNLNILHRINRELHGTVPIGAFRHIARWNVAEARMEMHLEAKRNVRFEIEGVGFSINKGETIHTEDSYKYGSGDVRLLLRAGGWSPLAEWTDERGFFGLHLATAALSTSAP